MTVLLSCNLHTVSLLNKILRALSFIKSLNSRSRMLLPAQLPSRKGRIIFIIQKGKWAFQPHLRPPRPSTTF